MAFLDKNKEKFFLKFEFHCKCRDAKTPEDFISQHVGYHLFLLCKFCERKYEISLNTLEKK